MTKECEKLCSEFQEIFEPGFGCLKNFESNIKFKEDAALTFRKLCTVPFAILEDVNEVLEAGVRRGKQLISMTGKLRLSRLEKELQIQRLHREYVEITQLK